jgi:hypothetical protein
MSEAQDDLLNSTLWLDAGATSDLVPAKASLSIDSNIFVAGTMLTVLSSAVFWIDASFANKNLILGEVSIEIEGFKVVAGEEILKAAVTIEPNVNLTISDASVFKPSEPEQISSIKNLFVIDGKPITEHNRTFSSSLINLYVQNANWNSKKTRYQKLQGSRRTFSLSWNFLPNRRDRTVDSRWGRDYIKSIAEDPELHVLKMINMDSDGLTPPTETEYNVIVKNYTESMVRRDVGDETYYWDCTLELEEVG